MLHDILRGTISNNSHFLCSDPTILIRNGYELDSRIAFLKPREQRPATALYGYINLKPEGPLFQR